ncbi:metal-dependent hydrolase [Paenarthrobacter sp. Z7-10]|uniref:metal-dependent hydrolase n=1 Tax=Paenarthrobacter sp. Z7-10 TaxID=2787635 RepID=UPI0022A939F2|nr:metal-dependent hydrolase [Paenarthrobacter sp. Z7-10]MCZ2403296.1 metal-dependent hydrolase [Paenarthrobacter sp. Z7-10]
MTLPKADTIVSYPAGQLHGAASVLHSQRLDDGRLAVLLDATPCHPVDAGWSDQGPDRAVIRMTTGGSGSEWPVLDCVVAATDGSELYIGNDVPVRKGTEGWAFVVAHLLPADAQTVEGTKVEVSVDGDYRAALNAGHTGCHLASLALNRALARRWSKDTKADALGAPDFDAAAIASSQITEFGSVDVFRLNKSLRRKGFATEGLLEELPAITDAINATLAGWLGGNAPVRIDRDGERLTDRRNWICSLPDGEASIPCGGTHISALTELGRLTVDFTSTDDGGTMTLRMVTRARNFGGGES